MPLEQLQQKFRGATDQCTRQLKRQVDPVTYGEIVQLTTDILTKLPSKRVGNAAAALQLAWLAYAEYGARGLEVLVAETRSARKRR